MNKRNEQFSFTFPKSEKLKSKIEIDAIFNSGDIIKQFPFRILYKVGHSKNGGFPKILITVPKKRHKLAVTRNLLKRRIREVYRLNKPQFERSFKNIQSIGIIYVSNRTESFNFINDKLNLALQRLSKTINSDQNE